MSERPKAALTAPKAASKYASIVLVRCIANKPFIGYICAAEIRVRPAPQAASECVSIRLLCYIFFIKPYYARIQRYFIVMRVA